MKIIHLPTPAFVRLTQTNGRPVVVATAQIEMIKPISIYDKIEAHVFIGDDEFIAVQESLDQICHLLGVGMIQIVDQEGN